MNTSYILRASASFILGMLFALFVISVNQEKTYMIVLPSVMGLFPSMVLGALMCSMVSGDTFIIKRVNLSFRLFSIIFISLTIFVFGFLAEIFFTDNIYAIIYSALFGLFLGYTFADWHVLLYRATNTKTLITISAGIFISGQYFSITIYSIISIFIDSQQIYPISIIICFICSLLLVVITYLDGILKKESQEYVAPVLNDFLLTQLQLLLLIIIAAQAILLLTVVEFCFQENISQNQWNQGFSDLGTIWATIISVIIFFSIALYILKRKGKKYLIYFTQILSVLVLVLFLIDIIFDYRYESLLYASAFIAQGAAISLFISFNSLVMHFFKVGTIKIFVPVTTAILLFFLSLYQSVAPVLVALSVAENIFTGVLTICLALLVLIILSTRMTIKHVK